MRFFSNMKTLEGVIRIVTKPELYCVCVFNQILHPLSPLLGIVFHINICIHTVRIRADCSQDGILITRLTS